MKRLDLIKIEWSSDFAYVIGLIATDGCLSKDNRHLEFTSKDQTQVATFKKCLGLRNKIARKVRGGEQLKRYYRIQFGSLNFYEFLVSIGLTAAKSKTMGSLDIPDNYFADFLRGCIDGDGNISIQKHPESQYLQLRLRLASASIDFLQWAQRMIDKLVPVEGGWIDSQINSRNFVLNYGKSDSIKILNYIYYPGVCSFLNRKYTIAKPYLRMWPNW